MFCQERGLSLYEDQELKDYEDGEASTVSLRDAISLAVPDETSSGTNKSSVLNMHHARHKSSMGVSTHRLRGGLLSRHNAAHGMVPPHVTHPFKFSVVENSV